MELEVDNMHKCMQNIEMCSSKNTLYGMLNWGKQVKQNKRLRVSVSLSQYDYLVEERILKNKISNT